MTTSAPAEHTHVAQVAPAVIRDVAQLEETIFEQAGLTRDQVGELPMVSRIPFQNVWEEGKAPPGNDKLYILAMFDGAEPPNYLAGDIRVYVMPLESPFKGEDGEKPTLSQKPPTEAHFLCYTVSRVIGNVPSIKTMPRDTWVMLVAKELEKLWEATWGVESSEGEE